MLLLPDGNGAFTEEMGLLVDKSDLNFGKRSWRYSMLVRDKKIEKMFLEPQKQGDPFEVSDADTMLDYINPKREAAGSGRDPHARRLPVLRQGQAAADDAGYDYAEIPCRTPSARRRSARSPRRRRCRRCSSTAADRRLRRARSLPDGRPASASPRTPPDAGTGGGRARRRSPIDERRSSAAVAARRVGRCARTAHAAAAKCGIGSVHPAPTLLQSAHAESDQPQKLALRR